MNVPASRDGDFVLRQFVDQIGAGVRAAEDGFVRHFERGLTLLARRYARPNEARIQDVVQTVLMHAIERLRAGALRDAVALPAYLRTCIVREVAALYRDRTMISEAASGATFDKEASSPDTPEMIASRQQALNRVVLTMESLATQRDREVLLRFYIQEQSRSEICAVLNIDEGHFRRVLFRARERLQELMEAT